MSPFLFLCEANMTTATTPKGLAVQIERIVSFGDIQGSLLSGLEGGAGYCSFIQRHVAQSHKRSDPYYKEEVAKLADDPKDLFLESSQTLCPLIPGGWCEYEVDEPVGPEETKIVRVDRAMIERGFKVFGTIFPTHMADLIEENGDANTGDILWQCILYADQVEKDGTTIFS